MKGELKNLFLYHVQESDEIVFNDSVVKKRGAAIPKSVECAGGFRMTFMQEGYQEALQRGMTDALDSMVVDANEMRGKEEDMSYRLYGAGTHVRIKVR